MKKYCPIVRINLPYAEYGIAHMYYCDKHSLTADVSPMNEYQIERLKEEALLGFENKGCIIHPNIKEYDFHDWMQNKDAYLLDINDFNNLTKGEVYAMQRHLGICPSSSIPSRKNSSRKGESIDGFAMSSYAEAGTEWLGLGLL